jgi:hypothetical protein
MVTRRYKRKATQRKVKKYAKQTKRIKQRKQTRKLTGGGNNNMKHLMALQIKMRKEMNAFKTKINDKKKKMSSANFKLYIESKQYDLLQMKNKLEGKLVNNESKYNDNKKHEIDIILKHTQEKYDYLQEKLNEKLIEEDEERQKYQNRANSDESAKKIPTKEEVEFANKYKMNPNRASFVNSIKQTREKDADYGNYDYEDMNKYLGHQLRAVSPLKSSSYEEEVLSSPKIIRGVKGPNIRVGSYHSSIKPISARSNDSILDSANMDLFTPVDADA